MDSVIIRSVIVYFFIFLVLRMAGKRTLSEMTTFDFILILIISESVQQALIDDDHSIFGGMLVIVTLVFIDVVISLLTAKLKKFDKVMNGVAIFLIENGHLHLDRMSKSRINIDDILEAGRKIYGIENLSEIKSAVLERDGSISIIPVYKDLLIELHKSKQVV